MRTLVGLMLMGCSGGGTPGVAGSGPDSRADVEACIETKAWALYEEGWAMRTSMQKRVTSGEQSKYRVGLYDTEEYRILVCGGGRARALDLYVFDGTAKVLARADGTRETEVLFDPEEADTYFIVVHADEVAGDDTHVGVGIFYRRGA